jgi:hypothetical protein
MTTLTREQIHLLQECGRETIRLLDPDTMKEYVLLEAEVYERLRSCLQDLDPRELFPALHRALRHEGWDDPKMDEYNRYG